MIKNYFLVTIRNFRKQLFSSVINVIGLTLAITTFIFLALFVTDELKYDSYHENKDYISRLIKYVNSTGEKSAIFGAVTFNEIFNAVPEFEEGFRLLSDSHRLVTMGDKKFYETIYYADPSIFSMLTLPAVQGNLSTALERPFTIVLTEQIAEKYFGDNNPIGKSLRVENTWDFEVTAVIKNIPAHSHINHEIIASISTLNTISKDRMTRAGNMSSWFYFKHNKNVTREKVQKKLNDFTKEVNPEYAAKIKFILEPLDEIYLYSTDTKWDIAKHGDIRVLWGLESIALLIMLMAAFNFTNLLSAQIKFREKELMVRKLLGAGRRNIIKLYIFETMFYILFSLIVSCFLLELFTPFFNELTNKSVSISSLLELRVIIQIIFLIFFIGFFAILYPSVITLRSNLLARLSGIPSYFKNSFANVRIGFKQFVTTIQFVITVSLIFGTIIIYKQMQFISNSKLGFNKEHLLIINNPWSGNMYERYRNYKTTISAFPEVVSVSASGNNPGENINNYSNNVRVSGQAENEGVNVTLIAIDYDLFETWQTKVIEGRDFSEDISSDGVHSVIINKAAADLFGLNKPIGARLDNLNNSSDNQEIIGVVENTHFKSFKEKVLPTVFYLRKWCSRNIVVRIKGNNIAGTLDRLEKVWNDVLPERPFLYTFADQKFDKLFASEKRLSKLILIFCGLAITISFIGLLSLISLITQMRIKEIGIRKILGASRNGIYKMMIREYVYIIIIACIISLPITYLIINKWL